MESSRGVILVTTDGQTAEAVAVALRSSRRLASTGVSRSLTELTSVMESSPPAAVVADLGDRPEQSLLELQPLTGRFTATRFVVVCDEARNDLILKAMEVGARHFLMRKDVPRDLVAVLERLVPAEPMQAVGQGSAVTVLSAGGGCGATTIAINVAEELRRLCNEPCMFVDMDCAYGSAATYLGLTGSYGLADVLSYEGVLDSHLITSTARADARGLNVLLSPASVNLADPARLNFDRLLEVVEGCKRKYRHTVFDAPRVPLGVAASLARVSRRTLVVSQMVVTDLRTARGMIQGLTQRGVAPSQIIPVVNRYRKGRTMISLQEAAKSMERDSLMTICNDYRSATRAINFGQPLAESSPRSSLRQEIRELAGQLSGTA